MAGEHDPRRESKERLAEALRQAPENLSDFSQRHTEHSTAARRLAESLQDVAREIATHVEVESDRGDGVRDDLDRAVASLEEVIRRMDENPDEP